MNVVIRRWLSVCGVSNLLLGCLVVAPLQGALLTRTWNGAEAPWNANAQWTPTGFPNNGASNTFHAIINSGTPTLNLNITLDQLTLTGGTIAGAEPSERAQLDSVEWRRHGGHGHDEPLGDRHARRL